MTWLLSVGTILYSLIASCSETVPDFTWKRNAALDNYISTSGHRSSFYTRSRYHCGGSCFQDSNCFSFFYNENTALCNLEGTVKLSTAGLTYEQGTRYYPLTDAQLAEKLCSFSDDNFSLVLLSDGTYLQILVKRQGGIKVEEARSACAGYGATLFRPTSASRQELLQTIVACPGYTRFFWVDGKKNGESSPWTTWNGQHTYTVVYWGSPNPDNPDEEFYMELMPNGLWNDKNYDIGSEGYICEKSA